MAVTAIQLTFHSVSGEGDSTPAPNTFKREVLLTEFTRLWGEKALPDRVRSAYELKHEMVHPGLPPPLGRFFLVFAVFSICACDCV